MGVRGEVAIPTLIQFSHAVAATADPSQVLELLARTSIQQLRSDGAAVLRIGERGIARVSAAEHVTLPASLAIPIDEIEADLGQRLITVAAEPFDEAHTLPLVSDGRLYGALILFFQGTPSWDPIDFEVVTGLVELAGAMLGKVHRYARLRRAYDDLAAAQATLVRTEKLRALGEMAAGIAHDLKNLLSPLILQADLLDQDPANVERVRKVAATLRRVVQRGVDTVERLRGFSRQSPDASAAEIVDLNALAAEAVEIVRPRARRAELRVELGAPPKVLLAPSELVSALVNILANALDALPPEGGTVTLRTDATDHGAFVEIRDTGRGMSEEVRRRLFEPFFTTKGKAGTGLGMAIVYAFVKRYAGDIEIESAPGEGTTIVLSFPQAPTTAR